MCLCQVMLADIWHHMTCDISWHVTWNAMWHDMWHDVTCDMTCGMTSYVTCDVTWHVSTKRYMTWQVTWHITWYYMADHRIKWHVKWHVTWQVTWCNFYMYIAKDNWSCHQSYQCHLHIPNYIYYISFFYSDFCVGLQVLLVVKLSTNFELGHF